MHVAAAGENLKHVGLRIFAGKAQQDTLALLCHGKCLQRQKCRREPNPFNTIFADYAAPQGVVAVQHQHLGGG